MNFETDIKGNPIKLLKATEEHSISYQENRCKLLTVPDVLKNLINVRQGEDENLVELAQLDMQWVKRLYTLLDAARRGVWIIGSLLSLAVLLIIGNTIRLDIQNRREAIEVSKLIGASDAFIRRPFLYTGIWYGISGGLLAWVLVGVSLGIMAAPVQELAALYHSNYELSGLDAGDIATLLILSCLLGLAGSWIAVGRHLSEIEPHLDVPVPVIPAKTLNEAGIIGAAMAGEELVKGK